MKSMTGHNTKEDEMDENKRHWFELACFAVIGACALIGLNALGWGLIFGF